MQATQDFQNKFLTWVADEFRLTTFTNSVLAGMVTVAIEVIFATSFGYLIFSGQLANQFSQALAFILIGNAILIGVTALFSSYSGSIVVIQDAPGVVLGIVAVAIIAALPPSAEEQQFATVVMMIVITTLMTGIVFFVLGLFKVGGLVRFLPYPVMGGFLAGTGWLLGRGGIGVMTSVPFGLDLFDSQTIFYWLPGVAVGIAIFVSVLRIDRPLIFPAVLVLSTLAFYIVTSVLNISTAQLDAEGWLVGSMPSSNLSELPLSTAIVSNVNWSVLWQQIPSLAPAVFISAIALLLNSSALELLIKKDINLSRELIVVGIGNMIAGMFGGMPGYHAISSCALNHQMSGGKRLAGLVASLLMCIMVFLGASFLMYIPKLILGGVLIYLSIDLLVEWVYDAWFKFPRIDFLIILSVFAVIVLSGFLSGIIFGSMLAIIMFVVGYSRVNIIKFALSGQEYRSRVTRSRQEQQILAAQSNQIYILKLQGFIFFGTANQIFEDVRERIRSMEPGTIRFVALDFAGVSGLDSTGLLSFARMLQWCQEQNIMVIMAGLTHETVERFARGGLHENLQSLRFFSDLDHGIEWYENEVISETSKDSSVPGDLVMELRALVGEHHDFGKLLKYLNRREYVTGEYLIRQGDAPDMIYLIESGQVTAQLEAPDQPPVRLETMGSGRTIGELGFYLNIQRTAAVVVDVPSIIYSLSKQELSEIEKTDPEILNLFHRIIVHLLGERVVHLIRMVEALER